MFDAENIDWDFWGALIDSFPTIALKTPALLAHKIRCGIPPPLRGLIWQAMSQSSATNLESLYLRLLDEKSPYEKTIQRDLARTFPGLEMFREEGGEGQAKLERVLRAYSVYDAFVGYCQGLGFLVGPLLMKMTEQQAFCVFVRLMETYDMRTMFTLNMEGLQLRLSQFESLLAQLLPALSAHLTAHSVHPAMYASQWFLTLFAYTYPMPLVLRVYDLVFAEGAPETIMRVAVALIRKNEEKLLAMNEFEDILDTLTARLFDAFDGHPGRVINEAMGLSQVITKEKLDRLAENYMKEVETEKKRAEEVLAVRFGFFSGKAGRSHSKRSKGSISSLASITSTNQEEVAGWKLESHSKESSPTTPSRKENPAVLHEQIEELVVALSQMQKDHVQVTQELVTMKMERMDLENDRESLRKRLIELERRDKKFRERRRDAREKKRQSMANLSRLTGEYRPAYSSRLSTDSFSAYGDTPLSPTISESVESRLGEEEETMSTVSMSFLDEEVDEGGYLDFVNSIRMSGDFGALVANGLFQTLGMPSSLSSSTPSSSDAQSESPSVAGSQRTLTNNLSIVTNGSAAVAAAKKEDSDSEDDDEPVVDDGLVDFLAQSQQDVTGELVQSKLQNFELQQQLERLCRELAAANRKQEAFKEAQREFLEKNITMREKLEKLEAEKTKIEFERDTLKKDYNPLRQRVIDAKKVGMELQLEKLTLLRDLERLTSRVRTLEAEKKVWTAMKQGELQTIFDDPRPRVEKDVNRRHTVMAMKTRPGSFFGALGSGNSDLLKEYQSKYHETETRCRELERMLADAKLKIVELETSLDRPSSSSSSSSGLASPTSSTMTGITISGQSDYYRSRLSMESSVSAVSDFGPLTSTSAKRSSMYGAVWGAFSNSLKSPLSSSTSTTPSSVSSTPSPINEAIPVCASPKDMVASEKSTHLRSSSVGTWLGNTA